MTTFDAARPRHAPETGKTLGIACGFGAGALWGLVFLAPELARQFSALQLAAGRYLCYGLMAAVLIAPRWRSVVGKISGRQWRRLGWLALTGNTLYYILLSTAVQRGGIAMTSLVIGFLPVAVTAIGSRDQGAVPMRKLLVSVAFCVAGTLCIGWQAFHRAASVAGPGALIGLLCAIGALLSWTVYAVGNARSLVGLHALPAHDWTLLTGLMTGAQSIVLIPLAMLLNTAQHSAADWTRLGAVSVGVALLASLLGNALWNRMSRLLPLTLVGQMILFETVFALAYGLLWEQRWPSVLEVAALVCVTLSVISCLAAHRKSARLVQPA